MTGMKTKPVRRNRLYYESSNGSLLTVTLDKNIKITSGLRDENPANIRPGRWITLLRKDGKLLGIAMLDQGKLADDDASVEKLGELGARVVREQTSITSLTIRHHFYGTVLPQEAAGKVMADLRQMPGLRSLSIGTRPNNSKVPPTEARIERWSKYIDEMKKIRAPFAAQIDVNLEVGSDLGEMKNLASLTLINPESRVDFASLKKLTGLKSLTVAVNNDADLGKAVSLSSLTGLILESDPAGKATLTPAGVKHLKTATNLTDLILHLNSANLPARDAALREVRNLPKLRTLVTSLTAEGAREIKKNTKIRTLTISQADDACMKEICENKGLLDLCIVDSKITNDGFMHLKKLPILQRLEVRSISDEAMENIGTISSLITLKIDFMRSDAGMVPVKKLTNLRHVSLGNISDKGIACLEELHNLEAVSLYGSRVTGEGLRSLGKLKSLTWLKLPVGSRYTPQDLMALKKSLPDLQYPQPLYLRLPDPFERQWMP